MNFALAAAVGVLLGSAPTAIWIGRWRGLDLRSQGSGNPGANNAFQLGGAAVGAAVLVVEIAKGVAAVWAGVWLDGSAGGVLAGAAATIGNVYNPWYGFRGGKGLAITAGALLAAWPALAAVLMVVTGAGAAILRRSGPAALLALGAYVALAVAGLFISLPGRWAVTDPGWMASMAAVQTVTIAPKHYADAIRRGARPASPGGS